MAWPAEGSAADKVQRGICVGARPGFLPLQHIDFACGFMGGRRKSGIGSRKVSTGDFIGVIRPLPTPAGAEPLPAHFTFSCLAAGRTLEAAASNQISCAAWRASIFIHWSEDDPLRPKRWRASGLFAASWAASYLSSDSLPLRLPHKHASLSSLFGLRGGGSRSPGQPFLDISNAPGAAVRSQQKTCWETLAFLHSAKLRPATDNAKAPQILEAKQFEGQVGLRRWN